VWGELFLTVVTLHVEFGEFSHEGLFNFCIVVKLFFDSDFDLDSFWMALCPNEPSVNNFCFVETLDFFNNNANNSLLYHMQSMVVSYICDRIDKSWQ